MGGLKMIKIGGMLFTNEQSLRYDLRYRIVSKCT